MNRNNLINKRILNQEIRVWKRSGEWSQILINYITEILEVCVSSVGADLEREAALQECWLFVIVVLKKVNTRKNSFAYLQTSVRHYVSELRVQKIRHLYIPLDSIQEPTYNMP